MKLERLSDTGRKPRAFIHWVAIHSLAKSDFIKNCMYYYSTHEPYDASQLSLYI